VAHEHFIVAFAEEVDEAMERLGVVAVVTFHEQIAGDLEADESGLVSVEDAEIRVEGDAVKMLAEEATAKAVKGADAGVVDKSELAAEVGVVVGGFEAAAQGLVNAGFHLGGGGIGEGDHEKLVHAGGRLGVADEVNTALGQDGRFARSGGGGDEDAASG
jgi:hypothetical protein